MSSLSCTVFRVKRLPALVSLTVAAALTASCTVMDVVGPRANREIMGLARQAAADGFSLDDAPVARDLRAAHAEQLVAEAQRLCGTDPEGATPSSCDVTFSDTDLPAGAAALDAVIDQVRADTVAAAGKVPAGSVDLVVAQAVDTVALAPVDLDGASLAESLAGAPEADLDAAREMLRREYALDYGLGLATAWADDALLERVDTLREASDERREELTAALELAGDIPQPLPGYEFALDSEGAAPTDAASAQQLVERLQADIVAQWRSSAAEAESAQWCGAAIDFTAQAQRALG